ncbi:MAG: hypothetical protein NC390_02085 [Fusobacterium sp.]|nr:hypothetical protein [Fusobacterium sp.]
MSFPVLGQVLGLGLIFAPALYLKDVLPQLADKYEFFVEPSKQLALLLLVILPGLVLMISAFWKYLVAYAALNSMTHSALTSGKVYDFPAHNGVVKRHIWSFVLLWLMISVLGLVAFNPFFIVFGAILFIYFILVFQVFTFETDAGVVNCFTKSFNLVKGNFWKTVALAAIMVVIAWGLTELCTFGLGKVVDSKSFLANVSWLVVATDYVNMLNDKLPLALQITPEFISRALFGSLVSFIVFGFTLPLRSICWTLWYKKLLGKGGTKKKARKGKKQLDPEILRRANLKDDEEV